MDHREANRAGHSPACTCVDCVKKRLQASKSKQRKEIRWSIPATKTEVPLPPIKTRTKRHSLNYPKSRSATRLGITLMFLAALIIITKLAFIGVEPIASYRDRLIEKITPVASNIRVTLLPTDAEIQAGAFDLINQVRIDNKLPPLISNAFLTNLAMEHCRYMKAKGYCNHDGFDNRANIVLAGGHFIVGENVAEGYPNASSLVDGWCSSPGHKENILNPNFRTTGLGYIAGYACQIFSD